MILWRSVCMKSQSMYLKKYYIKYHTNNNIHLGVRNEIISANTEGRTIIISGVTYILCISGQCQYPQIIPYDLYDVILWQELYFIIWQLLPIFFFEIHRVDAVENSNTTYEWVTLFPYPTEDLYATICFSSQKLNRKLFLPSHHIYPNSRQSHWLSRSHFPNIIIN